MPMECLMSKYYWRSETKCFLKIRNSNHSIFFNKNKNLPNGAKRYQVCVDEKISKLREYEHRSY